MDHRMLWERIDIENLYARQVKTLYRLCYSYTRNVMDAEDLVQQTLMKVLERTEPFASLDHEKAWLMVTAKNLSKNHLKKKKTMELPMEDVMNSPTDSSEKDIVAAFHQLKEKYRIPMLLYYVEGYDTKEIGILLNRRPSTVRTQLERGRKALEELLGGEHL